MTPPRAHLDLPALAGESTAPSYLAGPSRGGSSRGVSSGVGSSGVGSGRVDALAGFRAGLDALLTTTVEEADDVRRELTELNRAKRQLEARICRGVARLHRLEEAAVLEQDPDDHVGARRAAQAVGRELREDLGLTPSQVKAARAVGDRLADSPALADAMDRGAITPTHARVLDRTLRPLGRADRQLLEDELVRAAASGMDVNAFERLCRRRQAQLDAEAAEAAADARHRRRRAGVAQTADGMTALAGQWAGIQAEIVHTAVDAFTVPDAPGERRTAEQRTADAVVAAFRAALEGGAAATQHGVRPHVVIGVGLDSVADVPGAEPVADGSWTGPMVWNRVRTVLDDSSVSFITVGQDLPVAVTSEVRTVPVGLHRQLVERDGGCIREGCDRPASWCQVMHLGRPHCRGGRLRIDTAALGCREHHHQYDQGRLVLEVRPDGRPVLRPPP